MKIRARADKIELLKYSEVKMINTCSNPTDLKITDMRFVDIDGAPKRLKAAFWVKTPAMWTEFSAK